MNENELYVVKEYKFDNPLVTETDSILVKRVRDGHKKLPHNFKNECIYDIKLTSTTNNKKKLDNKW